MFSRIFAITSEAVFHIHYTQAGLIQFPVPLRMWSFLVMFLVFSFCTDVYESRVGFVSRPQHKN